MLMSSMHELFVHEEHKCSLIGYFGVANVGVVCKSIKKKK